MWDPHSRRDPDTCHNTLSYLGTRTSLGTPDHPGLDLVSQLPLQLDVANRQQTMGVVGSLFIPPSEVTTLMLKSMVAMEMACYKNTAKLLWGRGRGPQTTKEPPAD